MSDQFKVIGCTRCAYTVTAKILEGTGATAPDWNLPNLDRRPGCIKPKGEGCPYLSGAIIDARKRWEAQQVAK